MVRISIKPNKPGFYLIFDVTKVYQPDRLLVNNSHLLLDINMGFKLLLPLSLSEGNIYLTPFVSSSLGVSIDMKGFDLMPVFFLPLNFNVGVEMSAGKLKESLFWGLDMSFVKYFSVFDELGNDSLWMFKPSVYVRWFL